MKEETLNQFRDDYTELKKLTQTNFQEIEELKDYLENDPRKKEIERLQKEIENDPKNIRYNRLEELKNKLEVKNCYFDLHEAIYNVAKPKIDKNDTYGIFMRIGPYKHSVDQKFYIYIDLENYSNKYSLTDKEMEEFEKNNIVIYANSRMDDYKLTQEFLTGCIENEPMDVARAMIKKYNNKNK